MNADHEGLPGARVMRLWSLLLAEFVSHGYLVYTCNKIVIYNTLWQRQKNEMESGKLNSGSSLYAWGQQRFYRVYLGAQSMVYCEGLYREEGFER